MRNKRLYACCTGCSFCDRGVRLSLCFRRIKVRCYKLFYLIFGLRRDNRPNLFASHLRVNYSRYRAECCLVLYFFADRRIDSRLHFLRNRAVCNSGFVGFLCHAHGRKNLRHDYFLLYLLSDSRRNARFYDVALCVYACFDGLLSLRSNAFFGKRRKNCGKSGIVIFNRKLWNIRYPR